MRVGLYTGGLIFGMVRVLVNWWAYTWGGLYSGGLIFGGLRYLHTCFSCDREVIAKNIPYCKGCFFSPNVDNCNVSGADASTGKVIML